MNKLNFLLAFVTVAFTSGAFASSWTINDLPNAILVCREVKNGGVVLDGAKQLSISKDQFGQMYLTVLQKDQFTGNRVLINGTLVTQVQCSGYVPCELYVSQKTKAKFLVNLIHNSKFNDGHLVSNQTGAVDFYCVKK